MLAPRRWYGSGMLCMTCTKFVAFLLLRKFCTTPTKPCHASTSSGFMECMKFSCCIRFWMPGPSNISALNFSRLSPGNDLQMYLRHSPSLSRAFTYCLISSNFICRGGVLSCLCVQVVHLWHFCLHLWVFLKAPNPFKPDVSLYCDCPTYIRSTDVSYIQIVVQAGDSPFLDWDRFSSYAGCILCTQEPV